MQEDGSHPPAAAQGSRIAVHTELVREQLIDRVFDEVIQRYPGEVPQSVEAALGRAVESVAGAERADSLSEEAAELARDLSRKGYLTRIVETELFGPARGPTPGLTDALREWFPRARASWLEAVVGVSAELARSEPLERPDPDDERSMSWRVPGPGGHVRHYLALLSLFEKVPKGPGGERRLPEDLSERELKQCWMYGFYLRCCEESLPPEASPL